MSLERFPVVFEMFEFEMFFDGYVSRIWIRNGDCGKVLLRVFHWVFLWRGKGVLFLVEYWEIGHTSI